MDICIKSLIDKATQGDPKAQFELAKAYYYGNGIQQNYEEAVKWFLQIEKNYCNPYVYKFLGACCYYGYGIDKDFEKAIDCWEEAIRYCEYLGCLFLEKDNNETAHRYFAESELLQILLSDPHDENVLRCLLAQEAN